MDLKLHVMMIVLGSIFVIAVITHFLEYFDLPRFKAILIATAVFLISITISILSIMYPILFFVMLVACVVCFIVFEL